MVASSQSARCDDSFFSAVQHALGSHEAAAPRVIIDRKLRIRGFNKAYASVTLRGDGSGLTDQHLFDAFPDNPLQPGGVSDVTWSLERAMKRQTIDTMWVQRYDIPDPQNTGHFLPRVWTLIHSPLFNDAGSVVGVIQHADDITALDSALAGLAEALPEAEADPDEWWRLLRQVGDAARALPRYRETYKVLARENRQLREAQKSRAVIEQAKGILMAQRGCTADDAFQILRKLSQHTNCKLRYVAAALVHEVTGQCPLDGWEAPNASAESRPPRAASDQS